MRSTRQVAFRAVALAVAVGCAADPAVAMSLGNPEILSYLGQPLRLRVPVGLDDSSESAGQCVRLVNSPAGDVPGLTFGRVELERGATASYLWVSSPLPIGEPILRVAVEIGCVQRVRREFTLFLDPPPAANGTALAQGAAAPAPPALEFGPPEVIGYRGQPLLVNVPIAGEGARLLTEACVRPGRSTSTQPPRVLNDIRVALIDRGGERSLRIHTPDPVNDARVRFFVEVGCDRPVRREFALQIEPPQLASLSGEESAPPPVAARPKAPARRIVAHAKLPPVVPPAEPVATAQKKPEPVTNRPSETQPAAPERQAATPPVGRTDHLVLAPPEEAPSPRLPTLADEPTGKAPAPGEGPTQRELEVLKRVEELSDEVKKLRTELEQSNLRYRQLSERTESSNYSWMSAVAAVLLLGIGFLLGWRGRPRTLESAAESDRAGPMTRILGQKTEHARTPPKAAAAAVGPVAIPAFAEGRRPGEDTQPASSAIMVTEFGDTTQVLGELYSPYIGPPAAKHGAGEQPGEPRAPDPAPPTPTSEGPTPTSEATTVAGPPTKTEIALDLDLGQERPSILSPQTKTEIAVDIDLFERNSQIGRDLQREYERLDLLAKKSEAEPKPEAKTESKTIARPSDTEMDPPTIAGSTTVPLTTRLELDLDLSTIGQQSTHRPKKPE